MKLLHASSALLAATITLTALIAPANADNLFRKSCKLPKLRPTNPGRPYWVQTGQVMTFWDASSLTTPSRKTYTNEGPKIQDNDQYMVQCNDGYVPDEMCIYTCKDGVLDTETYCDIGLEDVCVHADQTTISDQCQLDFDSDEPWYDGKSLKQWWGEVLTKYHFQREALFNGTSDIPFHLGHGAAILEGVGFVAQHFPMGPTTNDQKEFNADAVEITGWVPGSNYAVGQDTLRGSTTVQANGYVQDLETTSPAGLFSLPEVTGPIQDFDPMLKITALIREYDPCDKSKFLGFPPECFIYHPAGFHTGSGEMINFRSPMSNGDIDLLGVCTGVETIPPVTIPALLNNLGNIEDVVEKAGGFTALHPASWSMHLCIDDDIYHPYLCPGGNHQNLPPLSGGDYVSMDVAPFMAIPKKMRKRLCDIRTELGDGVCDFDPTDTNAPYNWTQFL